MTKKALLVLIVSGLLAIALTLLLLFGIFNPPAKVGKMTVTSGGNTLTPLSNVLLYNTGGKKEGHSPLAIGSIWDKLPALTMEEGFSLGYTEYTHEDFSFTLYDEALKPLYSDAKTFTAPEKPGTYAVCVRFSWGRATNDYVTTENLFKIVYQG